MSFAIRSAAASDAAFVGRLFAREHVRGWLHAPAAFVRGEHVIIDLDDRPFGYLAYELEQSWVLSLCALAVWEPRAGGGRFALEYAIRRGFEDLGVHRIFLEILATNHACRRLCERLGFRAEGLYRDGYRDDAGGFHDLVPYGMLANDARGRGQSASAPAVVRLDHVQLAMPALGEDVARRFYGGLLGFREQPKPPPLRNRGGAWFVSSETVLHLGVDGDFVPAKKAHPAFCCVDYERLLERLRAQNVAVETDDVPFEGRRHCYISDPFGNRIELIDASPPNDPR